jgi:RNA polymerase sigma-70 factor (ECF subfamily)
LSRLEHDKRELLLAAYAPAARIQDVAVRSGRTVGGFYQWLHRMKRLLLDCVRAEMERLGEA